MRNLKLSEARCRGADGAFHPTICPVREQCQRFLQIELDRQLELPDEVRVTIKTMNLPRIGRHSCHFSIRVL